MRDPAVRSKIMTYLESSLMPNLVDNAPDFVPTMMQQFAVNRRGSCMPPSSLVESYVLQLESYDWETVTARAENIRWRPHVPELIRRLPDESITHRSRGAVVSVGFLRAAELSKRVKAVAEHYNDYAQLTISPSASKSLAEQIGRLQLEHIKVDPSWIYEYVDEHSTSSIGGGYKWPHTLALHMEDWEVLAGHIKHKIENDLANLDKWNATKFNLGIRGRAESLELSDAGSQAIESILTRSRIVMYHPSMSFTTALMPDKKTFYKEGFKMAQEILNVEAEIVTPYTHGGRLYTEAAKLFANEEHFVAVDGKNWESGCALVLGESLRNQMVRLGEYPALPSGHSLTSFWNTIASMSTVRGTGTAIISGDDINLFGDVTVPKVYPLEVQPEDTKYQFILGVSYYQDYTQPRIMGFKLTMDRADAMKPVTVPHSGVSEPILYSRKRSLEQIALHAGMFFGRYGERSLLDCIEDINWSKHYSFGDWVDKSLAEGEVKEPLAWAEELGINKVFT